MYSVNFDNLDICIYMDDEFLCNIIKLKDFEHEEDHVKFGIQYFEIHENHAKYFIKYEGKILTYRELPIDNIREIFQEIIQKRDEIRRGDAVKIKDNDWIHAC